MTSPAVVFIPNDETPLLYDDDDDDDNNGYRGKYGHFRRFPVQNLFYSYFSVRLSVLLKRCVLSLIPPFGKYCRVHVDFLGPFLIFAALACLLQYGHANKLPVSMAGTSPLGALLLYAGLIVPLTYLLSQVSKTGLTLAEIIALLGYGLFGHVLTLAFSLAVYHEESNWFFFLCLAVFGGPCAMRVALVLLTVIPVPAARLLVCTVVASLQLASLMFFHFVYMHRTFAYGKGFHRLKA